MYFNKTLFFSILEYNMLTPKLNLAHDSYENIIKILKDLTDCAVEQAQHDDKDRHLFTSYAKYLYGENPMKTKIHCEEVPGENENIRVITSKNFYSFLLSLDNYLEYYNFLYINTKSPIDTIKMLKIIIIKYCSYLDTKRIFTKNPDIKLHYIKNKKFEVILPTADIIDTNEKLFVFLNTHCPEICSTPPNPNSTHVLHAKHADPCDFSEHKVDSLARYTSLYNQEAVDCTAKTESELKARGSSPKHSP